MPFGVQVASQQQNKILLITIHHSNHETNGQNYHNLVIITIKQHYASAKSHHTHTHTHTGTFCHNRNKSLVAVLNYNKFILSQAFMV